MVCRSSSLRNLSRRACRRDANPTAGARPEATDARDLRRLLRVDGHRRSQRSEAKDDENCPTRQGREPSRRPISTRPGDQPADLYIGGGPAGDRSLAWCDGGRGRKGWEWAFRQLGLCRSYVPSRTVIGAAHEERPGQKVGRADSDQGVGDPAPLEVNDEKILPGLCAIVTRPGFSRLHVG